VTARNLPADGLGFHERFERNAPGIEPVVIEVLAELAVGCCVVLRGRMVVMLLHGVSLARLPVRGLLPHNAQLA
jgi:hypothetical protein